MRPVGPLVGVASLLAARASYEVMEAMPEAEIVGVQDNPLPTLEALYRAEYVGLVRLAFTMVGTNAEAEEIVQDSFVEISGRLDDLERPGAYLRTVVVNRCRSALRRRRLVVRRDTPRPAELAPEAESLWDVLEHLPEHQRIAVVLRYYGGFRASEIATIVDAPASTVRSDLRRALAAMRRELTP
jgi:RNA polymerase sigma factor (sigma-70 family)